MTVRPLTGWTQRTMLCDHKLQRINPIVMLHSLYACLLPWQHAHCWAEIVSTHITFQAYN